jgi:hypothetical protein
MVWIADSITAQSPPLRPRPPHLPAAPQRCIAWQPEAYKSEARLLRPQSKNRESASCGGKVRSLWAKREFPEHAAQRASTSMRDIDELDRTEEKKDRCWLPAQALHGEGRGRTLNADIKVNNQRMRFSRAHGKRPRCTRAGVTPSSPTVWTCLSGVREAIAQMLAPGGST